MQSENASFLLRGDFNPSVAYAEIGKSFKGYTIYIYI